jgi:hypothetical protein
MIPKSGQRFSEKIMLHQKLEPDDDSRNRHRASRGGKLQGSQGRTMAGTRRFAQRWLAHDPEKWTPVFGKDHAP